MLSALDRGLSGIVRSAFVALKGRTPSEPENALCCKAILAGMRFENVLLAIIALEGDAPQPANQLQWSAKGAHDELERAIAHIYRLALHRTANADEIDGWSGQVQSRGVTVAGMIGAIATSEEAVTVGASASLLSELSDSVFVQTVYETLEQRGAMADEVAYWECRLKSGDLKRRDLVAAFFQGAVTRAPPVEHSPFITHILGVGQTISVEEWRAMAERKVEAQGVGAGRLTQTARFSLGTKPGIRVSAIASLYDGAKFIARFMENITSQTIFRDHCELIIIDAASPGREEGLIRAYQERFPNIIYHRSQSRIGIYEAWNLGISMSRGDYITNTNLDDLRRSDSFELQASTLDNLPFADVTYQDFYYTFSPEMRFDEVAAVGVSSALPVITPYNLLRSNSPHNAPMWRRELHQDVGLFNESYKSAGDYEFWLRAVGMGKKFFKLNDPHVVYYVNPEGISTRRDTLGRDEANNITRIMARRLTSDYLTCPHADFVAEVAGLTNEPQSERELSTPDWRYAVVQRALRLSRGGAHPSLTKGKKLMLAESNA